MNYNSSGTKVWSFPQIVLVLCHPNIIARDLQVESWLQLVSDMHSGLESGTFRSFPIIFPAKLYKTFYNFQWGDTVIGCDILRFPRINIYRKKFVQHVGVSLHTSPEY